MYRKKKILIVDDEVINHYVSERMLEMLGWKGTLECATNGKEALSLLLDNCRKLIAWPDLILLDLHMPVMNGIEFLEELGRSACFDRNTASTIAIVSSTVNPAEIQRVHDLGIQHFIEKPITLEKLQRLN